MQTSNLAPVVLFVYARPKHTQLTLNALRANNLSNQTDLIIYSDSAKTLQDQENVNQVRGLIRSIQGFKSLTIIERETNYGLARNIIDGVTSVCEEYGRVIVLEDDLVTSPAFLQYMNNALENYSTTKEVWHISGWNYPISEEKLSETFLWREMNCWGWGTWKNRWQYYKNDPLALTQSFSKSEIKRFNLDGHHNFWHQVIENLNNTRNTWAIFWYATIFSNSGLCLNPATSLVSNIGFDNSGKNCDDNDYFSGPIRTTAPDKFPNVMVENPEAVKFIKNFYRRLKLKKYFDRKIRRFSFEGKIEAAEIFLKKLKSISIFYIKNFKRKTKLGIKYSSDKKCIILSKSPVTADFGFRIGTPIDRFYINDFLTKNAHKITGNVLEISESIYTKKYGSLVSSSEILNYSSTGTPNHIVGDLTRKETLPAGKYDCFICTQTLNFIFKVEDAISGIHHLLKENGTAIVSVAGLTQISKYDMERWGDYWRFTKKSVHDLFSQIFGEANIEIDYYGNALAACFLIQGIPAEEMSAPDLLYKDEVYQIIITVVATKKM